MGNQKHYPIRDFIVTSTEMTKILTKNNKNILGINSETLSVY